MLIVALDTSIYLSFFYENFYHNKEFIKEYKLWKDGKKENKTTDYFYNEIAKKSINNSSKKIEFTYFNIRELSRNDNDIILLYKILSPVHLLKENFVNDSNTLDKKFYDELLYIIGLEEVSEGGKNIITRRKKKYRASLIERTIKLIEEDEKYNFNESELFEVSLELIINWINRILFLKLLEGKLYNLHKEKKYKFLSKENLTGFNQVNNLFFNVLAKKLDDPSRYKNFNHIPYLNSSLFDKSNIESKIFSIDSLSRNLDKDLEIFERSILEHKKQETENTLKYLLGFLDAYDFSDTTGDLIKETEKTIINASVLGLIFEKINGYKDGSIYTPSFITMYMAKESVQKTILDKFKYQYPSLEINSLKDIENLISKGISIDEANDVINSIKICDPSVGSGHFLVSVLNEIIFVKHSLDILKDDENNLIKKKDYTIEIQNDEIVITDDKENIFEYSLDSRDSLRVQKTIFREKKTIIENCLFGVDINPNSVKICRLRLWIELLKNTFYKSENELEVLPNIDINIKCGNSLISKIRIDKGMTQFFNKSEDISKYSFFLKEYRKLVFTYKNATNRKKDIRKRIEELKNDMKALIPDKSKLFLEIEKLKNKIKPLLIKPNKDDIDNKKIDKLNTKIIEKEKKYDREQKEIYGNSFEWRIEFPEVLDDNGDFLGFDCIIGNPPYIKEGDNKEIFKHLKNLEVYQGKMDIWYLFGALAINLIKNNCSMSFIATNNWRTNAGARKFRNYVLGNSKIESIIDFGNYMIFDNANIQTMIMSLKKEITKEKYNFDYRFINTSVPNKIDIDNILAKNKTENIEIVEPEISNEKYNNSLFTFNVGVKEKLLDKIKYNANFYFENKDIGQGIVYPQDFLNKKSNKILGNKYNVGDGIFCLSSEEKENLNLFDKEKEIIKPQYTSKELDNYYCNPINREWVIYTGKSFNEKKKIDMYPNIKKHLDKFKKVITSDNKPYGLHRTRDNKFFKGEKIVSLRKCSKRPVFTYSDFDCYVSATFFIIKPKKAINMKYLTGILNSKLIAFWLKNKGKMQGNNYQVDKEPLLSLPILRPTKKEQKPFVDLVDIILNKKEKGEDTSKEEKEIDQMVYNIYGLTKEEIEIIENK